MALDGAMTTNRSPSGGIHARAELAVAQQGSTLAGEPYLSLFTTVTCTPHLHVCGPIKRLIISIHIHLLGTRHAWPPLD